MRPDARLQRQGHRYQVVTGKGYRPKLSEFGRRAIAAWTFIAAYFALSKLLPFFPAFLRGSAADGVGGELRPLRRRSRSAWRSVRRTGHSPALYWIVVRRRLLQPS
jgi:ABC-type Fe3+ transport system permease subunit